MNHEKINDWVFALAAILLLALAASLAFAGCGTAEERFMESKPIMHLEGQR